jgi:transcriptional regulator with XRE-family HTH domain
VEDADKIRKRIGRRLAELRELRGYTQEDLSNELHVSVVNVQENEYGNRNFTIDTLVKIANVLGVKITALFERPKSTAPRKRGGARKWSKTKTR